MNITDCYVEGTINGKPLSDVTEADVKAEARRDKRRLLARWLHTLGLMYAGHNFPGLLPDNSPAFGNLAQWVATALEIEVTEILRPSAATIDRIAKAQP